MRYLKLPVDRPDRARGPVARGVAVRRRGAVFLGRHAGASGYIASMTLLGFAPEQVRPTALALNLLVGGIGLFRWWRGGHVRWRNVLPFVLASAPTAFLSAQIRLPKESWSLLLGIVLLVAAIGVFRKRHARGKRGRGDAGPQGAVAAGSAGRRVDRRALRAHRYRRRDLPHPLLLFAHWMPTREASGTSVAFVWINSLTGLAGLPFASRCPRCCRCGWRGRAGRVARHPSLGCNGCRCEACVARWAWCC